jgi:hypothetical protein
MTGRWARGITLAGTTLAWVLGCAGGAGDPADDGGDAGQPIEADERSGGTDVVPAPPGADRLIPQGVSATRVESGTDPRVVHLTLKSLEPIRSWWTDNAGVVVTGHADDRLVGAWWEAERVRFAVAERGGSDQSVVLRVYDSVPDVSTTGPDCDAGQRPVRAGWPEGGVLATCVATNGTGRPVGPFRVERYGAPILEGSFDQDSRRSGVWTLRNDAGKVAATGAFEAGEPIGGWMFSLGGIEHQVLYVDGLPQDLPFAQLPIAGADPRPWADAAFQVLDADLEAGVVAAAIRFRLAPDPATGAEPRACPALGRVDPQEGLLMQLLRAGHREPLEQWMIYDSTPQGSECTTEEAAAEALAAANAAFADRGLDPSRHPPLIAPAAGADPFGDEGVQLTVDGHALRLKRTDEALTLEAQLLSPDLLGGSWLDSDQQRVRSAELSVDEQPLEEIWMRWPASCDGAAAVAGAIAEGPWAALVYRSAACTGGGPLWSVGPPLRFGAPEELDGERL